MIAYIPHPNNVELSQEVVFSLTEQPEIDAVEVVYTGNQVSRQDKEKRFETIYKGRKEIIRRATERGYPYFLMNNSYAFHRKPGGIKKMQDFLEKNKDWAGVALLLGKPAKTIEPGHIGTDCIMFRTAAAQKVKLRPFDKRSCDCVSLVKSFREAGWHIGFVDNMGEYLVDIRKVSHDTEAD